MTRPKVLVGLLFVSVLGLFCVAQQVEIKKVPIKDVSPHSGQEMYIAYCGACHGRDARGNGPAAPALKTTPADLTKLTRTHGGKFPEMHVYSTIRGDATVPAHGDKDMPVWGSLFASLHPDLTQESEVHHRISNLTGYLKSLQQD